jgi:hypothetical protein
MGGRSSKNGQTVQPIYRVVTIEKTIDFAAHGITGSVRNKPGGRSKSPAERYRDKMKAKRETFLKTHPTYYADYARRRRQGVKI